MTDKEKHVFETIYERRSIRKYLEDKQVEKDKIKKLLEAGMAAPSACNLQPWEFIVVYEKDDVALLKAAQFSNNHNATMAIVVCANTKNVPWEGPNWMIDCSAAVENMMLAAAAMELGSLWVGAFHQDVVRNQLNIPENIHVMNIIFFGYPNEKRPVGTRYNEEAIYWSKYDPDRQREMRTMEMLSDPGIKAVEV